MDPSKQIRPPIAMPCLFTGHRADVEAAEPG
jgi:hypothetical protein